MAVVSLINPRGIPEAADILPADIGSPLSV